MEYSLHYTCSLMWIMAKAVTTTGWFKVRGYFDTPLFSGPGWPILISFEVLIAECLRFFLMYNTWCLMNLAPPKVVAENKVKISHISQNWRFSPFLTRVDRGRGWLLGPLWTDLAEILRGEQARVWQQMIRISLMCVDIRGSNSWKTIKKPKKIVCFLWFFLTAVPAYINAHWRNSNHRLPYPSPFTT